MRRLAQPDPEDALIETIYCFGCGRKLGVAPDEKTAVFCSELCWHKEHLVALDASSARNRAINFLIDHAGLTVTAVADAFEISRARVNQVLAQSNGDYLRRGRRDALTDAERADKARAGRISVDRRRSSARK